MYSSTSSISSSHQVPHAFSDEPVMRSTPLGRELSSVANKLISCVGTSTSSIETKDPHHVSSLELAEETPITALPSVTVTCEPSSVMKVTAPIVVIANTQRRNEEDELEEAVTDASTNDNYGKEQAGCLVISSAACTAVSYSYGYYFTAALCGVSSVAVAIASCIYCN